MVGGMSAGGSVSAMGGPGTGAAVAVARGGPVRQAEARRHNLALVVREISAASLSRAQVATRTGLSKATVSTLVEDLLAAGLVRELTPERGMVGRPGSPLVLSPSGPAALGLEINVDYISCCLVDFAGRVRVSEVDRADNRRDSIDGVLGRAGLLVRNLFRHADRAKLPIGGLGIGVPGLIDARGGLLRLAPNLPSWSDVPICAEIAQRAGLPVGCPVMLDNEANLAALGELWFGGSLATNDFVLVSGEVGVGGGLVVDGRLFRGVRGSAGELGHVVVDPAGPACGCGSRGCLEALAGQDAILSAAGLDRPVGTTTGDPQGAVSELVQRLEDGDRTALAAADTAGTALGVALAGVVNLLDLPTVVLGGLYAVLAPWVRGSLDVQLRARVVTHAWAPVDVRVSTLGPEAAVRGAAGVVRQAILDDPGVYLPVSVAG